MRKMKNIISISVVILSTTVFLSAVKASDNDHQKKPAITSRSLSSAGNPDLRIFELGFHYMPTFYNMDFRTSDGGIVQGSVSLSHGFGAMMAVNLSQHIGFQSEIDYYKASQSYKDLDVDQNVDIKYIDIPVLLSLNTNKTARVNLNAVVGPQFGINVGSNISSSGSNGTTTAEIALKKGDVGAAFGAGLEFALNQAHSVRLDLGYRGFYGLVSMNADKTSSDTYNVMVDAKRKNNAAYLRLTFLF
jgi:hypothetical protein